MVTVLVDRMQGSEVASFYQLLRDGVASSDVAQIGSEWTLYSTRNQVDDRSSDCERFFLIIDQPIRTR